MVETPEPVQLYRQMLKSRLFEEAVAVLWHEGLISGEVHMGTGEEAIVAGTVLQLRDGDAMALDHRGVPPLLMRGVDPALILRELLGHPGGLCGGLGGRMHLFAPAFLAASSGIVGSSGPAAAGFALAGKYLRPGSVTLAFFGEGALNEGMLMESFNLAAVWKLPVIFICKDNDWSITTPSGEARAVSPVERALGFGLPAVSADGADVMAVWEPARVAIERARAGDGPSFIHATCRHLHGHYLGYQVFRVRNNPWDERGALSAVARSALKRKGGSLPDRLAGVRGFLSMILNANREPRAEEDDPVKRLRHNLGIANEPLTELETEVVRQIQGLLDRVLADEAGPSEQ